jgi:XXXCH domain-containing protein
MGSREVKIEKQLTVQDTENFLRNLADGLTGKAEGDLSSYGIDLQDFKKIRLSLKQEAEQFGLKVKVKYKSPTPEGTPEETGIPVKYKSLKKQIKKTFKDIKTSLDAGNLPTPATVETFMAEAEMMVSFTDRGYGDEYYGEFMQMCNDFKQAFEAGDPDLLLTAYNCIDARKALCHDKYD